MQLQPEWQNNQQVDWDCQMDDDDDDDDDDDEKNIAMHSSCKSKRSNESSPCEL